MACYSRIHEDLSQTINYPRWPRGIYPTEESAQEAMDKKELYVLKENQIIIGSVILNHDQDLGYENVDWQVAAKEDEVMVVHTLAIDPRLKGKRICRNHDSKKSSILQDNRTV